MYEISDGVRRSKAADMNGNSTIKASVQQADGTSILQDVPVDSLHSPFKSSIDVSTPAKRDRFERVKEATETGKQLPPIQVNPGNRGPKIRDVTLDETGES
ncbi:MAG: hypothetical protein V4672_13960 [Verrucomicrobiota bacterium]